MSVDLRIHQALCDIVESGSVPAVPLKEIRARMNVPVRPARSLAPRFAAAAAIVVAALAVTLPLVSPALVQSIEARYRAALQALGGIAPPAAPRRVLSRLESGAQTVTLAQAQSRVRFTLSAPAGLPKDAVLSKIVVTPTELYTKATHSWTAGAPEIVFWYRRSGGREFVLVADAYDLNGERLGKYMFEARDARPDGTPVLIKHERFAWRNGEQVMTAIEGPDISAREILAIQAAMRGTPVALRPLHAPDRSPTQRLRMVVKP